MSDYWKKKLEDLNNRGLSNPSNEKNGYWQSKLTALEKENKKKKEVDSQKSGYWQSKLTALEEENKRKKNPSGIKGLATDNAINFNSAYKDINVANYNSAVFVEKQKEAGTYKSDKEKLAEKLKEKGYDGLTDEEKKKLFQSTAQGQRLKNSGKGGFDFFQKGAFEDGFDWYDIPVAIGATVADAGLGVVQGILNVSEGVADAVSNYVIAPTADLFGADDYANRLRHDTGVRIVDDVWLQTPNDFLNEYSMLGSTSDAIAQGGGQLAVMWGLGGLGELAGLGATATSALTLGTTGVSAMGSGSAEAYAAGAEVGEAELYGLIAGGSEVLTEMLFGGMGKGVNSLGYSHGLSSVDDMFAKKVADMFTSQIAKNMAEFGVKATAEGVEEVLSGIGQAIGKKLTYMSEEEWSQIVADENLLEQFVVGAVTSGIGQGASVFANGDAGKYFGKNADTDYITGLTKDEQSVLDKVIESRIAEKEAQRGKELTNREKNKVAEESKTLMERGFIDAEVIESVLGGESYDAFVKERQSFIDSDAFKAWREAKAREESLPALQKEYDKLHGMKRGEMTGEQIDREAELKKKIDDIKSAPKSADLEAQVEPGAKRFREARDKVRGEVSKKVSGTKLAETYRELDRRKTKPFTADPSKYKTEAARQTVQGIMDSKLGDGSNEFADKVELLAGLAERTGVVYKLMTEEQLKEAGYWEEGFETHGVYSEKTGEVLLNAKSKRNLYWTIGHETGHVLEKTGFSKRIQEALFNHAIAKEGIDKFNERIRAKEEAYKGREDTTPEREVANDLLGEYIFTDYEFISNLAKTDRNIVERILGEIKHFFKLAVTGSREQRDLEKAMHYLQKALDETSKGVVKSEPKTETKTEAPTAKAEETKVETKAAPVPVAPKVETPVAAETKVETEVDEDIAPTAEVPAQTKPVNAELENLRKQKAELEKQAEQAFEDGDYLKKKHINDKILDVQEKIYELEDKLAAEDTAEEQSQAPQVEAPAKPKTGGGLLSNLRKFVAEHDTEVDTSTTEDIAPTREDAPGNVEGQKNTTGNGGVKYSLMAFASDGRRYVEIDQEQHRFDGYSIDEFPRIAKDIINERFNGRVIGIDNKMFVNGAGRDEFANPSKRIPDDLYETKMRTAGELDNLLDAGTNFRKAEDGADGHYHEDVVDGFDYFDTLFKIGDRYYEAVINIKNIKRGKLFKDVTKIKDVTQDIMSSYGQNPKSQFLRTSSMDMLPNNGKKVKGKLSYSSIANSFFNDETLATDEFLNRDYHETEFYKQYVDDCISNMRQTMEGFDESKVGEYRESIRKQLDGIVGVAVAMKQAGYDIRDSMTVDENGEQKAVPLDGIQDSKNRSLFTSLEPNSDYITSHDISTICDKRKNFAEIYDEIVRIEESKGVPKGKRFFDNINNYFAIHKIMADKGLTTPCRQCYVESMRKNLAPMATAFLDLIQETNPDNTANAQLYHQKGKDKGKVKESNQATREFVLAAMAEHPEYNLSAGDLTIEMLTTEDGLAQLRIQAPLVYEAFNSFYGQAKPKMPKSATPFRFGELTAMLTDSRGKVKKGLIDKINHTGGFRLQSYSDFQIQNFADVLQVLFEAGTLGLNGHAYTKVPAFLDATEGTNLKRNISIFMYKDGTEWKLDRNDSFPYSLEEIYELVKNDKTGNTSIIAVSQNREMSAWIMANDLVGYGIPFHKSGLAMATVRDTIVRTEDGREVKGYTGTIDHTKQQTEVYKSNVYDEEGKLVSKANTKVKKGIDIYGDSVGWDFENKDNLSRNELIKKNLTAYLDACEKAGYRPKFREYVMNNGGVLNDVLRFAKELGFVDENATIDDISFEYKDSDGNVLYRVPYGYYKFLGDFGMFTPDGKAAPQKPLSLEGYDFEKAKEFFSDAESLRRTEILQQFANGTIRDGYRESEMSTEDLENLAARKRTEVAYEALGIEEDIAPVAEDIAPVGGKFSMSKADDVGYHAGDLGKAESYLDMTSANRSTGHFGTGTYFVGNEDAISTGTFGRRPHHKVNFNNYNLYRVRNTDDGYKLHRDLNNIDDGFSQGFLDAAIADRFRFSDLRGEANELAESYSEKVWDDEVGGEIEPDFFKAHIRAFTEVAKANDIDVLDYDSYLAEQSPDDIPMPGDADYETYEYEYYDYLLDALKDADRKRNEGYSEFRKAYFNLWLRFGKRTNDALQKVLDHDAAMEQSDYDTQLVSDSRATVFMKALGYEGIDVRETGLDNTTYGSVIYDLKGEDLARKQEIGTAKYSMSKVDSDYMNAVNNDYMGVVERLVEEAANTAGYETRMFHETDADNIHIFDISRGTHGGTDYQTPYGIFTKTSPKNIGLGSKQMSLFVKAHNTLRVENREDVVNKIPGFAQYYDQITEIDRKYDALANELEDEEFDALMEWMEEHPDADMDEVFPNSYIIENKPADIDSEVYHAAHKKRIDLMNEWKTKYDEVAIQAKSYITNYLRSNGYDSMYFVIDGGSRGRQTDSLIVLDENQVKSADPITYDDNGNIIPLSQRFNSENDDIRYSMTREGEDVPRSGVIHDRWSDFDRTDPLDELAPVREDVPQTAPTPAAPTAPVEDVAPTAQEAPVPDEDIAPMPDVPPATEAPKAQNPVEESINAEVEKIQGELDDSRKKLEETTQYYDDEIARLQTKYDALTDKESKKAQDILRNIERLTGVRDNINSTYEKRISDLEAKIKRMNSPSYRTAAHRRSKMEEHTTKWQELIGDTSTWKDFALGLSYKTKTLRRILRKVVRGADGKADIELADRIYDELETKYDHNEALLKRESARVKEVFEKLKLNSHEDTYAHMLGELRHNPQTELTQDVVDAYYKKHKKSIDSKKVDTAITEARKTFDELIVRVNEVLREQGFKEIPYRQGYFPHFTNPKQTWLHKLFNWKPVNNEIPTSIAGLTDQFKPQRSWQTFNKERKGDTTDYSLYQGLDTYIHGALDWIYHIDDLQSRRSLENYIRYIHSEEGVKARIDEIKANDTLDAEEAQAQIDAVLAEARNPLNGFVSELMRRTNTLANKKASADRGMEEDFNRKVYSTMTNLNNRINANMVVGSLSSALTNFIPMVQSWHQVSPVFTVAGLGDYIRSVIRDDGMMERSDFLTNRLMDEQKLYKTGWDKAADKAAWFMNVVDGLTSNTVWRSKYLQNRHEKMSEAEAIRDADQFAKNLMAGRSRGNAPTIFDAKNPVTKLFTAFQLEVANQYGYMFEDVPQDSKNVARLIKGYATAFVGAYLYNALYSSLVGRDAAFDPISIFEELFKDLGWGDDDDDDEEEDVSEALLKFGENIIQELPFVGGLAGGGRIPISSALPYNGEGSPIEGIRGMVGDVKEGVNEGNWEPLANEMLKPLYYLALPFGGGQIKKTYEGLSMFDDDLPISGSYTESGKLRFPVEDTIPNRIQAALFGQYASKDARYYFDNDIAPLGAEQIQEYQDVDIPIRDYWKYRDGLSGLKTAQEKADYINSLNLSTEQKNILINNQLDRKEPVDMTDYDDYGSLEEFDFANKNPEKYEFFESIGVSYQDYKNADEKTKDVYNWAYQYPEKYTVSKAVTGDVIKYKKYTGDLNDIRADKDASGKAINGSAKQKKIDYINSLNIAYGAKLILYRDLYPSDNTYNKQIIEYLNGRSDISFQEKLTIMRELGFTVKSDGTISWN